ncbi:hypothetical protein RF11_11650 [Thelohanellus kitauei]|uniref:Uncharacterized protein n=1 Tax=Thelohanellus kitauei TaxID=669202 RepID=A0A0C2M851_THEKT|nr:hypothetical protein RF11_11650 [Thelohanellus kitauei]
MLDTRSGLLWNDLDKNPASSSRSVSPDEPKILFKIALKSLVFSDELCHVICVDSGIVESMSGGGREVHEDVKNITKYFKSIGIVPYEIHFAILGCNDPILTPCIEG